MSNPQTFYKVGGVDLSNIFQPLGQDLSSNVVTKYKVNGADLNTIFAAYISSNPQTSATKYKVPGYGDLNTIFAKYILTNVWVQTNAPTANWESITSDSSGQYLAAAVQNEYIYTSSDYGNNWTNNTNSSGIRNWIAIASSSNGQYLAAAVQNEFIHISSNYGVTWSTVAASRAWSCITSDSSGQYLAAGIYNTTAGVATSSNYGLNWSQGYSGDPFSISNITSSSNGQYLAICNSGTTNFTGNVYISSNASLNWTLTSLDSGVSVLWRDITSSSDGSKIAVTRSGFGVYISLDYGTNWQQKNTGLYDVSNNDWLSITSSSNFEILAVIAKSNISDAPSIFISQDSGDNWVKQTTGLPTVLTPGQTLSDIKSSSDGKILCTTIKGGGIYQLYTQ